VEAPPDEGRALSRRRRLLRRMALCVQAYLKMDRVDKAEQQIKVRSRALAGAAAAGGGRCRGCAGMPVARPLDRLWLWLESSAGASHAQRPAQPIFACLNV
jgi:hypothetical protein